MSNMSKPITFICEYLQNKNMKELGSITEKWFIKFWLIWYKNFINKLSCSAKKQLRISYLSMKGLSDGGWHQRFVLNEGANKIISEVSKYA